MQNTIHRDLPQLSSRLQKISVAITQQLLRPNLTPNRAATELARELVLVSLKPVRIMVKKGEMIVRDGERISQRHLLILEGFNKERADNTTWMMTAGAALLIFLLAWSLYQLQRRGRWGRKLGRREMILLAVLFVGGVAAARVWILGARAIGESYPVSFSALIYLMPIAAGPMMMRLVLRLEWTALFTIIVNIATCLMLPDERFYIVSSLVGSLIALASMSKISARNDVVLAGARAGVGQAICAFALVLYQGQASMADTSALVAAALLGGLLSGLIALSLTPIVELVFGYTTALKLLELANLNHPALKELLVEAPGSYHHSVMVGSLVEAAAESIGANSLLARVMAYYHDLGKGCNAPYFIENQRAGDNPHDKLKASMSAMIIKRHVTDGLAIARRYKLGEPILAGIAEHHGTTLIQYFYHRAKTDNENSSNVSENDYRYPGRKPQTREAALVMLGDSIEAASRTLANPTQDRLQGLVNKIINTKFADGQLDECDLTLRDLHIIAKAFMQVLTSIYHRRVEYPELNKEQSTANNHGNHDSESPQAAPNADTEVAEDSADHLRRLGL